MGVKHVLQNMAVVENLIVMQVILHHRQHQVVRTSVDAAMMNVDDAKRFIMGVKHVLPKYGCSGKSDSDATGPASGKSDNDATGPGSGKSDNDATGPESKETKALSRTAEGKQGKCLPNLAAKEKKFRPAALEQTQIYNVVLALTRLMQVLYMAIVRK